MFAEPQLTHCLMSWLHTESSDEDDVTGDGDDDDCVDDGEVDAGYEGQ